MCIFCIKFPVNNLQYRITLQIMKYFSRHNMSIKESSVHQYQHTLFPETREELEMMISDEIKKQGNEADLNHIDVSKIEDFSRLFKSSEFNGDISE